MKILIPVLGFGVAGGYRVLSELASQWIRMGHDVHFLAPAGSGGPYFPTIAPITEVTVGGYLGQSGMKLRGPHRFIGAAGILALTLGMRQLAKDFDVIFANHSLTTIPVSLSARGRALRFYYVQAYEPEYYWMERQPIKFFLSWLSFRLAFKQIINSPNYVNHGGVRPIAFIPPGIDLQIFHRKVALRNLNDGEAIIIGCIGRREPSKGIAYLLSAFADLHAKDSRYRLKVAFGNLPDGWSHPAAEVIIPKGDSELAEFYRSIDILVAPGIVQHGAPHYPVMEALASGTPVVTTGFMPATSLTSWIVANKSVSSIVEAVTKLVNDPDYIRRVDRGAEAIAQFSWPSVAGQMINVFLNNA